MNKKSNQCNDHDIDDGLRAGLITLDDLRGLELTAGLIKAVEDKYPDLERPRLIHETLRRVITTMIYDVLAQARINGGNTIISFSPEMQRQERELKQFLNTHIYRHELVLMKMSRAKKWLSDLFDYYLETPSALPEDWQFNAENTQKSAMARQVCDFIAGMTDRFAMDEYRRVFDLTPIFR